MGPFQPRRPQTGRPNGAQISSKATQNTSLAPPVSSAASQVPSRAPQESQLAVWIPPTQPATNQQVGIGNGPPQSANTHFATGVGAGRNETSESRRTSERVASSYPPDILDTLDRITSDQRISPQDPPTKLFELISFLMRHRGQDAASFADDCLVLYNVRYRRKPRTPKSVPMEGQPRSQGPSPDAAVRTGQTNPIRDATTRVPEVTSGPGGGVAEIIVIPDQPHAPLAVEIKEEPPSPPKVPLPKITSRMFSGREELAQATRNRWERFIAGAGKPASHMSEDKENYIIWKNEEDTIRLPADYCRSLTMLHDKDGEFSKVHLDVLRFLWQYMVVDSCSGAVFNPTIGYPKTQLVLTFCYLVRSHIVKKPRIVIFCPRCAVDEWQMAARSCRAVTVLVLRLGTWAQDAKQWEKKDGVLICPFDVYLQILKAPQLDKKGAAARLLCRPGPGIAIVDEASRLVTLEPALRRALCWTKTTARLALTNLPLASNVIPFWSIINWATPELLGPLEEYWYVFVRSLIKGNKDRPSETEKEKSSAVEAELRRVFRSIVYTVDGSVRTDAVTRQGHLSQDYSVFVNLSADHKKIYEDVVGFVSTAVERGEVSAYVAMYVLLLASTSISALLQLLSHGMKDDSQNYNSGAMGRDMSRVERVFRELHKVVLETFKDSASCAKLEIAVSLYKYTANAKGKLVIYSAMPQVHEQLVSAINAQSCQCDVFVCDISSTYTERRDQVHKFNTSGPRGAVLLAPIGAASDCVEEAGWGIVNASHILFVDSVWNCSTAAQGVNRVCNFATRSAVHVYHLVSVETVEILLHAEIFKTAKPSLMLPQVSKSCFEPCATSLGDVTSQGALDECISTLAGLTAFHHAEANRTVTLGSDLTAATHTYNAELTVAVERNDYFRSLPAVIDSVQQLSYGANLYETLRNTRAYRACNVLPAPNSQQSCSFLSSWNDYFRIYEQGAGVEDIVEPPEGQKLPNHSISVLPVEESGRVRQTAAANHCIEDISGKRKRPEQGTAESSTIRPSKRRIGWS